ncbi:MAG: IS630 family transposase [Anaerolineae bacterium]
MVKEWCIPEITPEFLTAMETALALYERPAEKARPLVCFDEKSVELHVDARTPLPVQPHHPKRQDYEYERGGTRNVFLFVAPKVGQRHTLVTQRRTKEDWAKAMRYLADELYPEAEGIDVVLDNLNTHKADVLIEILGKAEADRLLQRLTFHYTPLHGSWLNMAEIELSVMARQCTRRRLGDAFTLATELIAWEQPRNAARVTIRWKFTRQDARRVFAQYYPAISSC